MKIGLDSWNDNCGGRKMDSFQCNNYIVYVVRSSNILNFTMHAKWEEMAAMFRGVTNPETGQVEVVSEYSTSKNLES